MGRAFTLYHLKRYAEALDVCERAMTLAPDDRRAWRAKYWCLLGERRFEEAIAAYDHILTLPDVTPEDHAGKGVALLIGGRYADAARSLTYALTFEPDNPQFLNNLGCVYTRLQYYEQALSIFEQVHELDERLFHGWMNAAEVLISLGRYDEAHETLMRAKELRNTSGLSVSLAVFPAWLGILHTRQGHYDEAIAAFKEALAADPDNSDACMGFVELLQALGENEKAASMIERSLTLDPFDARAWSLKGRILRATGDESGADEAEARGQRMLAEQRAQLAAWEREQAGGEAERNAQG